MNYRCPKCGVRYEGARDVCPNCGFDLVSKDPHPSNVPIASLSRDVGVINGVMVEEGRDYGPVLKIVVYLTFLITTVLFVLAVLFPSLSIRVWRQDGSIADYINLYLVDVASATSRISVVADGDYALTTYNKDYFIGFLVLMIIGGAPFFYLSRNKVTNNVGLALSILGIGYSCYLFGVVAKVYYDYLYVFTDETLFFECPLWGWYFLIAASGVSTLVGLIVFFYNYFVLKGDR